MRDSEIFGGYEQDRKVYTPSIPTTIFNVKYVAPYVDVFVNGFKIPREEYTATNGTSITLSAAVTIGDTVELVGRSVFNVANAVSTSVLNAAIDSVDVEYFTVVTTFPNLENMGPYESDTYKDGDLATVGYPLAYAFECGSLSSNSFLETEPVAGAGDIYRYNTATGQFVLQYPLVTGKKRTITFLGDVVNVAMLATGC